MKKGDIVRVVGACAGYRDTYSVVAMYTNEDDYKDRLALIVWAEPNTNRVISQFTPEAALVVVEAPHA